MSLRARLLAGLALVGAVLVAVAIVVTTTTRSHLVDQLDDRLGVVVAGLRGVPFDPDTFPLESTPSAGAVPAPPDDRAPSFPRERVSDLFEGLIDSNGELITFFRPNVPGTDVGVPVITADDLAGLDDGSRTLTVDASVDGERYRVLADRRADGTLTVTALPMTDVDDTVARLVLFEVVGVVAVLAGLALVGWWVIRLGIRPVKDMTAAAADIAAGDLTVRVPESAGGTEAGELALALNAMLGRIESAVDERTRSEERLRRFVADASHELRTPITTIRGYAELYHQGGLADGAGLDDAMRRTHDEARRMGRLIEDMLELARYDEQRPLDRDLVDLAVLAADAGDDASAVMPGRLISVETVGDATVLGDADRLRQVVANVVANALVHTPDDTPITIRTRHTDDGDRATVVFEVHDHGPGMAPEVAARVTERFYRADPSRSRAQGGSGLGMAIVDSIAAAHGGEVEVDSVPGRGTIVRIGLPAAPRDAVPPG